MEREEVSEIVHSGYIVQVLFAWYPKFGRVSKASFVHRRVGRLHRAWLGSGSFGVIEFLKLSREAVGHHGI